MERRLARLLPPPPFGYTLPSSSLSAPAAAAGSLMLFADWQRHIAADARVCRTGSLKQMLPAAYPSGELTLRRCCFVRCLAAFIAISRWRSDPSMQIRDYWFTALTAALLVATRLLVAQFISALCLPRTGHKSRAPMSDHIKHLRRRNWATAMGLGQAGLGTTGYKFANRVEYQR
jgi:hypothetical protein